MATPTPTRRVARAAGALRAARYNRVSKDSKKNQGRSVAEQDVANLATIKTNGWAEAGVYADNDRGASTYSKGERPDWQRLMEDITLRKMDVLVIWELSRGTRDRAVWAALVAACQAAGVKLCVGGKLYDLDDPDDAFALDLQLALAVRESAVTRKRVTRAVDGNVTTGRPHGRDLFGYRREYDPNTRALVKIHVVSAQAAIIREAAERALEGEACESIARDFAARGITAPHGGKPYTVTVKGERVKRPASTYWSGGKIRATLINPSYAALRVHQGEIVGGAMWPPILTIAQHQALVEKLVDPARSGRREGAIRHLLSGLVTCGKPKGEDGAPCGGPVSYLKTTQGRRTYTCKSGGCVTVGEAILDAHVEDLIARWIVEKAPGELIGDEDSTARAAAAEAKELQKRLDSFYTRAARGGISAEGLEKIEADLLPQIAAATTVARARIPGALRKLLLLGDEAAIVAAWKVLPLTSKRDVIEWIADIKLIPARARGVQTFDPDRIKIAFRGAATA